MDEGRDRASGGALGLKSRGLIGPTAGASWIRARERPSFAHAIKIRPLGRFSATMEPTMITERDYRPLFR